ncbi:hypothetical protein C2S52_011258 [Perilla frutescens var. hirtella]|nr:hypothetical protein C2S52_011258 [Perilla frutescens var. hirtella]
MQPLLLVLLHQKMTPPNFMNNRPLLTDEEDEDSREEEEDSSEEESSYKDSDEDFLPDIALADLISTGWSSSDEGSEGDHLSLLSAMAQKFPDEIRRSEPSADFEISAFDAVVGLISGTPPPTSQPQQQAYRAQILRKRARLKSWGKNRRCSPIKFNVAGVISLLSHRRLHLLHKKSKPRQPLTSLKLKSTLITAVNLLLATTVAAVFCV